MAQFKVGDKARIVNVTYPPHLIYNGRVVTIVSPPNEFGYYEISKETPEQPGFSEAHNLAPLTPDSQWADEKLSQLKRDVMKPLEIDAKQMEEVRG